MLTNTSLTKNGILSVLTLCSVLALLCSPKAVSASDVAIHEVVITNTTPANFQFSAMGRDIELKLEPSRFNRIFDSSVISNQHISNTNNTLPRLYQGHVVGDTSSWARISFEQGIPNGYIHLDGKLLQLDSRSRINQTTDFAADGLTSSGLTSIWDDDALILLEPNTHDVANQLLQSFSYKADTIKFAPQKQSIYEQLHNKAALTTPTDVSVYNKDGFGTAVTRAIRIGIAVDSRFNETHQQRGLARALSIINSVDAIYQSQLGIALVIEAVSVYEDPNTDPMRYFEGSVGQILSSFRSVRINDANLPADLTLVHLFSGHRDPDRVIGLGWIDTACRLDGFDVSISTPFPFDTLLAAHEIAHNLGALHDDDAQCDVDSNRSNSTLMLPNLSSNSTSEFSACSIRSVQSGKNAGCNIDNIDVAINMSAFPTSEILKRSLVIHAQNNDTLQRSVQLLSETEFPEGTQFSEVSAGCTINGKSVYCNHGTVRASGTNSVSVTATLPNQLQEDVIAEIVPVNTSDVQTSDNRAVIKLLQSDTSSGEAVAADNTFLNDVGATPNDGIGSLSWGFILSLFLTMLGQQSGKAFYRLMSNGA